MFQTHLKRIRYDLLLDDIVVQQEDNEPTPVNRQADPFDEIFQPIPTAPVPEETVQLTEEQLERLRMNRERAQRLREEKLRAQEERLRAQEEMSKLTEIEEAFSETVENTRTPVESRTDKVESEEYLERIRINKEKALKLREERIKAIRNSVFNVTDECIESASKSSNFNEVNNFIDSSEEQNVHNDSTTKECIMNGRISDHLEEDIPLDEVLEEVATNSQKSAGVLQNNKDLSEEIQNPNLESPLLDSHILGNDVTALEKGGKTILIENNVIGDKTAEIELMDVDVC